MIERASGFGMGGGTISRPLRGVGVLAMLDARLDKTRRVKSVYTVPLSAGVLLHQQKIFPSGRNGSIRVDALRQSRQRHPSGGLLHARRQFNASRSISPSDRCFTVSSRSVGLLF